MRGHHFYNTMPNIIYSEIWELNRKVKLVVTKASNGPIYSYGKWDGKRFYDLGWTNFAEKSIAKVKKLQP